MTEQKCQQGVREWDDLTPGRATDRKVAEALGYTVYHYDKGYTDYWILVNADFDPVVFPRVKAEGLDRGERDSEEAAWADVPAFSTDVAAAWDLLEHFPRYAVDKRAGSYWVWIESPDFLMEGQDFCLAVCKDALLVCSLLRAERGA